MRGAERDTSAADPPRRCGIAPRKRGEHGFVFVRAQEAHAERQAEGAVEVVELGPLTVLPQRCQGVSNGGPARSLRGGDWSPAISVATRIRFAATSKLQRRSSLRHRPPDHRPAPQPAWKTWRADDAESSQGTCDTHGPQAVSSSRLEAARIGRSFGEGQPLMGQERQPSLPKGPRSYFTLVLRAQSLQGSSEALPRCWTELRILPMWILQNDSGPAA